MIISDSQAMEIYRNSKNFHLDPPAPKCWYCNGLTGYDKQEYSSRAQAWNLILNLFKLNFFVAEPDVYIAITECSDCYGYFLGLNGKPLVFPEEIPTAWKNKMQNSWHRGNVEYNKSRLDAKKSVLAIKNTASG